MEKLTHKINYSSRDKNIAKSPITDNYSRTFRYLRIAVNERCNFRCIYCMPEKGTSFNSQNKLLTCNEIFKLIEIMADLNVEKIRFTGGEPLLRKSIPKIIGFASRIPSISSINLTTNGFLLSNYIESLQKAGLTGINISLDTLNPKKFEKITRKNGLGMVLNGIESAIKSEIPNIKLNVVTMRGFNDNELVDFVELTKNNDITIRFIELMPFDSHQIWKTGKFYSAEQILTDLKNNVTELFKVKGSKTEKFIFRKNGYKGRIAIIPAFTRNICGDCNRIRITADGKLLNCLYSKNETNLRDAIRRGLKDYTIKNMIRGTMKKKYINGWVAQNQGIESRESMTQIGG
ncbi:uncharacterized protein METZ01_LOCUS95421 [marine metagenome]|uniref:GTP 3',8-cyclase n=1 Tax=marine metagenome TaxID=408172 RepID=A0A381VSG4_9ZZZZ